MVRVCGGSLYICGELNSYYQQHHIKNKGKQNQ